MAELAPRVLSLEIGCVTRYLRRFSLNQKLLFERVVSTSTTSNFYRPKTKKHLNGSISYHTCVGERGSASPNKEMLPSAHFYGALENDCRVQVFVVLFIRHEAHDR